MPSLLSRAIPTVANAAQTRDRTDGPSRPRHRHDSPAISIPVVAQPKTLRARAAHVKKGRHLARQESWNTLAKLIRTADRRRLAVGDGALVAELLAAGARADAMEAAREAVSRSDPLGARYPVSSLEAAIEDDASDVALALVLALAHIDVARLWCGADGLPPVIEDQHRAYSGHLADAARLIAPFDPLELDSPLLASLRCRLLAADLRPRDRVADDYEDLIDLAPNTPGPLRALGRDLLPRRFGNYEMLDTEARRSAARTGDVWGQGGYAWVYLDALALDPGALRRIDAELFVAGLHDIVERCGDQHTINVLAAFTGLSMSSKGDRRPARIRIAACFDWIARDHLREVHPLVWDAAPTPGTADAGPQDLAGQIARGKSRALSTLADHFALEIAAGQRIEFHPEGLRVLSDG
ncbi:hypothetical protein [Aestuariicoccus sp. MJ-SS9]|uniref:hypothetical protein n=1 Tax=Aestuariicoccus sp. MJ-SS9 TaxID=3079855 RepID=UPI00290DA188|nr:hypothetical protein [Aestuariicoccus sp. MJ-SS9]MDU8911130.1 hypothetical protein [Aestuariicoccus sp. MJ-SS9]